MRIKKYKSLLTLSALLFAFIFLVVPPGQAAVQFGDIQGHWAEASIQQMADEGVVKGYPDGTFKPDNNISRAEFATVLVQAFKMEKKDGKVFNDTSSHWAKDYIATASAHGVVSGYNNQMFGPDNYITREEMALMTVKAADLKISGGNLGCSDSSKVSVWAKDAVATAYANKLIAGMPDGSFQPQANATRAQAIMVLSKAMQLKAEIIEITEPETPATPSSTSGGGGGGGGGSDKVTVKSIEILTEPDRVIYTEGDTLDLTGLTVTLNKSNGTTEDVALANFAAKGITTSPANGAVLSPSVRAVTITVKDKSVNLPITVNARSEVTVTNVSCETRAANVNWYRFIVNGTYSELQIKTADGIPLGPVTSRTDFETAGYYQGMASPDDIIVIYVDDIERYRGIPEVYSPGGAVITGIAIKTAPEKVTYTEGDPLDLTGLVVTQSKSDGTDEDTALADFAANGITTSPVNGAILTTADSAVVIAVNGKTASLAISVEPEIPSEVTVTNVSVDKYWNGYVWNFNLYRFTVNGTYSTVEIKTEDGTAIGPKIHKETFETLGYYLGLYWEGTASLDSVIVIYVDGVEKYRGIPAAYENS